MTEAVKTAEQIAAEKAAVAKAKADQKAADKAAKDAEKAATKKAADDKKAADKQAAADAKAAKAAAPKVAKIEQNGVVRPGTGSTAKVWSIADQISAETKAPATRKAVSEAGLAAGLVIGTINTQYGKWRKFNGLQKEVKVAAPVAPAAAAE